MLSAEANQTKTERIKQLGGMAACMFLAAAIMLTAALPAAWAGNAGGDIEASIFFELNNTDGDLGIHAAIDGDPWKRLEIENPRDRKLLYISVRNRLRRQGLTQLAFESAEPNFGDLAPRKFFRRFPEGIYEVEGMTLDGEEMEIEVEVTHRLPAPPENVRVNDMPVSQDCGDAVQEVYPDDNGQVLIEWAEVTLSHPDLGRTNEPIEVEHYEVILEQLDSGLAFRVELPPEMTEAQIPAQFVSPGGEYKLEILIREAGGNQTAAEYCFDIMDE